jgi:hypothetical protein
MYKKHSFQITFSQLLSVVNSKIFYSMQSQCFILTFGHQDTFHTSQLSKVRELSFGQPPPSLKTSHTESVKASHSVRSTSRSQGQCKAMLESPNCCLKDNFCHIHKEIHILKYLSLGYHTQELQS